MYELAGVIIFVLDILAILDCLQSSMDTPKKLLWILLILVLPLAGMLLYFLLAKRNRNAPLLIFVLTLLMAFASTARADDHLAGYDWSDKLGRGVLNMVSSPVELARTIHIQSNAKGPAYG